MRRFARWSTICGLAALAVAASGAGTAPLAPGADDAAEVADTDWPTYHGDLGARQHVPLDQIDASNVARLEVAWSWQSPDNPLIAEDRRKMAGSYKSTPLKVGDRLYVNTSLGQVAALDAGTGETLWVYDTKAYEAGRPTNLGFNSRGLAYWTDGEQQRLFQPSNDATLWAIDAGTGQPVAGFGDGGKVDLIATLRRDTSRRYYTIMSAPLVVGDVVVVGSSIFDGPTRREMPPGDVRAFDVRTGELRWTFHNPPMRGERGYETWEDGSADYTGNANVWTNFSADGELGLVYLPFGTPTNDWYGGHRKGDNLFAESIVCVRAATGEYVWHYQLVHHGLWDYDIPAAPTLFDATIDGRERKAVAVITKQGFVYVFDRVTGEPIWPIEEREVPQSTVPGEQTSPTQPFPTKPPPFESQGISDETIVDFTPEIRAEAMEILKNFHYGPIFTPPVVVTDEIWGTVQHPGWAGGANWGGAAFDPDTSRFYVPSFSNPTVVGLQKPDPARSNLDYIRGAPRQEALQGRHESVTGITGPRGLPILKPPYGRVTAYDLSEGDLVWQVPHGDGIRQQIVDLGLPDPGPVGSASFTGPLLTDTLLFLGQGRLADRVAGEDAAEGSLVAYDKQTGAVVAEVPLPARPSGTPMSYMHRGRQHLVFAFGGGPKSGLLALALPASSPEQPAAVSDAARGVR
ncbi:MAG: pyrroloquinoline quinone-dependent dehydrogenase [Acidobacteria bacterium]|nr:MAG: pyrroloquinoline quinone-dependent dehydrogenase [Acidobacteriota bacterium]REK11103.1 MAG: pyrroloquinoline quinone-dependent dehydrogenase [Acidobacteriota bacterium]